MSEHDPKDGTPKEAGAQRSDRPAHPLSWMWAWAFTERGARAFKIALAVLAAGFFFGELALHRHAYLDLEGLFGFYAIFGFLAFAFVVLTGKPLRFLLGRDENYYDTADERGEGADGRLKEGEHRDA